MDRARQAVAGTLESNDIYIAISANNNERGNNIVLESIVMKQFGPAILAVIEACLADASLQGVEVAAKDRGALDCTIKARMETAITRYKSLQP